MFKYPVFATIRWQLNVMDVLVAIIFISMLIISTLFVVFQSVSK